MAFSRSLADIKRLTKPWLYRKLDKDSFNKFDDAELVDWCNIVARELNDKAELWLERYQKNTVANQVNYELQRRILRVNAFEYKDGDNWKTQRWTFVGDVVVLDTAPSTANIEIDISYLGDIEKITNDDNEKIDLPEYALDSFMDLLKLKMQVELLGENPVLYREGLDYYAQRVRQARPQEPLAHKEAVGYYLGLDTGEKYDITDQWVSNDSVMTYASGEIEFID